MWKSISTKFRIKTCRTQIKTGRTEINCSAIRETEYVISFSLSLFPHLVFEARWVLLLAGCFEVDDDEVVDVPVLGGLHEAGRDELLDLDVLLQPSLERVAFSVVVHVLLGEGPLQLAHVHPGIKRKAINKWILPTA